MKLFVGLGNPGEKYARNRHNVGFMAVDRIAEQGGFAPWKRRFRSLAADGELGGERILLLKPQTFMNDSGEAVGEAQRFLKIPIGDVVVFHDEIDLAPGRLKVKVGGGNAGHNGLRSLSAHIGNDYVRVRIGVGHPGHKDAVQHYVLHDFTKTERQWLEPLLDAIAGASARLAKSEHARFLTDVARALKASDAAEPSGADSAKLGATASSQDGEAKLKRRSALAEHLKGWLKGRKA
jgi:PTH1 family peptidyl-tRNA hydrolase